MKKGLIFTLTLILSFSCMNRSDKKVESALPGFIDIVDGQTIISDSLIICELSLKQLPKSLKFNSDQLLDNALEYEWGVYFDNDSDGKYDISFTVSNWGFPEKAEVVGEILKNTQSNIWRVGNEGGSEIGDLNTEVKGDKIILTTTYYSRELNAISSNSKIKYQTFFNNGLEVLNDSLIIIE